MRNLKSPVVAAIASAALTASVVGGVAIAQTSGEITACVAENSGNVRIVRSANDCKPNESSTFWSQQGPQGPQGLQGEPGPAGATHIVQRNGFPVSLSPGDTRTARASCLPGETAVGGAGANGVPGVNVIGESPRPSGHGLRPTQWEVRFHNTRDFGLGVAAVVLCASP